MRSAREALAFGLAAGTMAFGGCSLISHPEPTGPVEYNGISECHGNQTNVEPTYKPEAQDYSHYSDPVVLRSWQRSHAGIGQEIGFRTLVCDYVYEEHGGITSAKKLRSVLTTLAIDIAQQMREQGQ